MNSVNPNLRKVSIARVIWKHGPTQRKQSERLATGKRKSGSHPTMTDDWLVMTSPLYRGTLVCGDDMVDVVVVVETTTTVDIIAGGPPPPPNEDELSVTGGGLGSSGLGLAVTVVVLDCIVLILFSSQLKRGPSPRARAAAWSDDELVNDSDESSTAPGLGGRPERHCEMRWHRFAFCFSTTSTTHR